MANITFIIGNGLDLSLGFKTTYKDFFRYVEKNNLHPKNKIYKDIKNDSDTWSDFERKLGVYTKYIESFPTEKEIRKESIAFHDDLADVTDDLAEFLATQEKLIDDNPPNVSFGKRDFLEGLTVGQKDILAAYLDGLTRFNFITLNYTKTLERILPRLRVLITPQNIIIDDVHHIHGDLIENMTLGVSDETQLSSAMKGSEKDDLIKPRSIASTNDGRIQVMKRIIDNSGLVVLFGTSIGETDKYIWEYLVRWLEGHSQRYIVIHKHDTSYLDTTRRNPRRTRIFNYYVQSSLLNNASLDHLDEDEKTLLLNRMFVIHNTKHLFARKK